MVSREMRGQLAGANQARRGAYTRKLQKYIIENKKATQLTPKPIDVKLQQLIYGRDPNLLICTLTKEEEEIQILSSMPKREEGSIEGLAEPLKENLNSTPPTRNRKQSRNR